LVASASEVVGRGSIYHYHPHRRRSRSAFTTSRADKRAFISSILIALAA
jgi:hypothetical protein